MKSSMIVNPKIPVFVTAAVKRPVCHTGLTDSEHTTKGKVRNAKIKVRKKLSKTYLRYKR